jgi:clan AA aspartic protease
MISRITAKARNPQIFLDGNDQCMGEIRTQVRLTNAADEEMAAAGKLPPENVRSLLVDAVVDTGAARSVVPQAILDQLGGRIREQEAVRFADGREESVGLSSAIYFCVQDRETVDDAYVIGHEVLIGQTILEKLDLLADCKNCQLVPNPAHPDGPRHRV